MAKKKQTTLPQTVYVYRENDGKESYLVASEDRDGLADGAVRRVGTYQLIEQGDLTIVPKYAARR